MFLKCSEGPSVQASNLLGLGGKSCVNVWFCFLLVSWVSQVQIENKKKDSCVPQKNIIVHTFADGASSVGVGGKV